MYLCVVVDPINKKYRIIKDIVIKNITLLLTQSGKNAVIWQRSVSNICKDTIRIGLCLVNSIACVGAHIYITVKFYLAAYFMICLQKKNHTNLGRSIIRIFSVYYTYMNSPIPSFLKSFSTSFFLWLSNIRTRGPAGLSHVYNILCIDFNFLEITNMIKSNYSVSHISCIDNQS